MSTWLWIIAMLVIGFSCIEAWIIRNHREKKENINLFYSIHRLLVQRKPIRIEDYITLSATVFVAMGVYLMVLTNFSFSFEKDAGAQVRLSPKVATQAVDAMYDENQEPIEIIEVVEEVETVDLITDGESRGAAENSLGRAELVYSAEPVRRYEEHVFDVVPANVMDEIVWEAETFMLPVGQKILDESASGGVSVRAMRSAELIGELAISDPTTLQKAGIYKASFTLSSSVINTADEVVVLQIWDGHNQVLIGEKSVRGQDFAVSNVYQDITFDYERNNIGSLQVKVLYPGTTDVGFDKVSIEPVDIDETVIDPAGFYRDVPDTLASGSITRVAKVDLDIPGRIAFGPYDDSVGEGYYRAAFRMKVDDNTSDKPLALIDVSSNAAGFKSAYKEMRAVDFNENSIFQDFYLDFYKPAGGYLEFRVYYYGTTDLYFDRVDLYPIVR